MDHQDKHKLHKEKEHEQKKKEEKAHEAEWEKTDGFPIHPAWVVAIGVALIGMVVYMWTIWWR
jgi:hypothetical protein